MTNIPTIEELGRIGCGAAKWPHLGETDPEARAYITAIRDAVVAACRPQLRPIAEMPEKVPEGCERMFAWDSDLCGGWAYMWTRCGKETHYIDIALPSDTYPADFETAFKESGFAAEQKDAAFKLWKGGAR